MTVPDEDVPDEDVPDDVPDNDVPDNDVPDKDVPVLYQFNLVRPSAIDAYPKHILFGIYRNGLISEHMSNTPFARVINSSIRIPKY